MERVAFSSFACSISRTAAIVAEPWTPLILRDLFLGFERFDEIQRDLGVASNVLASRLRKLAGDGVVERQPDPADARAAIYRLTAKGRDLYPLLLAMLAFGDKWEAGRSGAPLRLRHRGCGRITAAVPCCSVCGEAVAFEDLELLPGPGGRIAPGTALVAARLAPP